MTGCWNRHLGRCVLCALVLGLGGEPAPPVHAAGKRAAARTQASMVAPARPYSASLQLAPGDSQRYLFAFVGGGQYQFVISDQLGQSYRVAWTYVNMNGVVSQTSTVAGGGQLTIGIDVPFAATFQATVENLADEGQPSNSYTIDVSLMQ